MPSAPPDTGSGLRTVEVKRRQVLPKALLTGVVAGLLAGLFRITLQVAETARLSGVRHAHGTVGLIVAIAVGALGGGFALWLVRRFAPEASGSGIPHLKAVVRGEARLQWRRLLPIKFLAGVIGIGSGFALGREGPTIQMGGSTGLMVEDLFRVQVGEDERKALISAGAGAGLAAAFNAPLAGMMFVLEELQVNFTPVVFVAAFLASAAADIVARVLTGSTPVFLVSLLPAPGLSVLPGALILGVIAGVAGVGFNRSLLVCLDFFDGLNRVRPFWLGAATGAVMGLMGWIVPGMAGTGTDLVHEALAGGLAWGTILLIMVARYGMTVASYGCGAAGGIFVPMFVLGSLGGLAFGSAGHIVWTGGFAHPEIFAVLGMGSLFTAIVRAPLTALVLMIELTGIYDFMLPLLVACLAAYGVAEGMGSLPIYEALRRRSIERRRWEPPVPRTPASP